jgi:hypothetical protein
MKRIYTGEKKREGQDTIHLKMEAAVFFEKVKGRTWF